MAPANEKHTKTPEIEETPANKHVEPTSAPAGGSPSTQSGRFTFVTVSVAIGVEVISAPQPAHLRHLGQL